jgi:hypothetical protein
MRGLISEVRTRPGQREALLGILLANSDGIASCLT